MRDFLLKIYKIWLFELPVFNVIWRHLVTVPLFFIYFLIFKHFFLLFGRVLVESTRKPVYSDWTRSSIIQNCFNLPGGYIPQKYIKNLFSNKKTINLTKENKTRILRDKWKSEARENRPRANERLFGWRNMWPKPSKLSDWHLLCLQL